jgi:hypothetical protein
MPTDINNENLFSKSLDRAPSKPYVDGNPGPSMREARKVIGWANIANVVHNLFA